MAQVGDWDLCPTFPQVPLEADSRLEIFPLFNICNCIEPAETASRRDILSIDASVCKVRHLTFLCLISLPGCTAEQLT